MIEGPVVGLVLQNDGYHTNQLGLVIGDICLPKYFYRYEYDHIVLQVEEEKIVTFRWQRLFEDYLKQCRGKAMDIKLSAFVDWIKKIDITQITLNPLVDSPKPQGLFF